jgi:hypothetical protein
MLRMLVVQQRDSLSESVCLIVWICGASSYRTSIHLLLPS